MSEPDRRLCASTGLVSLNNSKLSPTGLPLFDILLLPFPPIRRPMLKETQLTMVRVPISGAATGGLEQGEYALIALALNTVVLTSPVV